MRPILLASALVASLAGACRTFPPVDLIPSVTTGPALSAVNPMEVAILPVLDDTVADSASWLLDDMRHQAQRSLVERSYTSMGLAHVDTRLVGEGGSWSMRDQSLVRLYGRFEEDAVLGISVGRWDESEIMRNARVAFDIEAQLVGGEDKQILWHGRIEGSIKAGGPGPAPFDRQDRARDVAARAIAELMKLLPARR